MMKKVTFFFLVIATLTTTFYSCKTNTDDLWDSIHQLDGRVTSLEELCKQMNGNISSLQKLVQALQDNNSITMVTPVKQGEKTIGYTISFTKGEPITIYHGEKGDKGEQGDKGDTGDNGKDGTTPTIGVKQHADGIYYWTLNGDWLRDNSGNMIKAEGKDGADGEQGEEGKAGITPQLKIEDGYWWVSYGEDSGWIQLDKAIADSKNCIFEEVTQDDDYVYFNLTNGTQIRIPKSRSLSISFYEEGLGVVTNEFQFKEGETKELNYTVKGNKEKAIVKAELLNNDGTYTLKTLPTNETRGVLIVKANTLIALNQIIITISDSEKTIMSTIYVSSKPTDPNIIIVHRAGTLANILKEYNKESITQLKIIGYLNNDDIRTLNNLPQLAYLDMEDVYMDRDSSISFSEKNSLVSIILPKTLKEIIGYAFSGCSNLKEIDIPSSVTSIGYSAFEGCRELAHIELPSGLKTIEECTFMECNSLAGELTIPSGVTSIGGWAFQNCSNLTGDLEIPSSVTSIGEGAFIGCGFTGRLVLPDNITIIPNNAFCYCSKFTGELIIPSGVTSIGKGAFQNCSGFEGDIIIPAKVTLIGESAFHGCYKGVPSKIYCKALIPPVIGDGSFWGYYALYVPIGSAEDYRTKNNWDRYSFTNGVEEIEFVESN